MNIVESIAKVIQSNSGVAAYLAALTFVYGLTIYYLSSLLATSSGRAALWYVLVTNTPNRYYRLLIVAILRQMSEVVVQFSVFRRQAVRLRLPTAAVTSGAISLALTATVASFTLSNIFGVQAKLGPINLGYASVSWSWFSLAMLVLIALASYVVFSGRRTYWISGISVLLAFSLIPSPDDFYFGVESSSGVVLFFGFVSLLLVICCRSGFDAFAALVILVLFYVLFSSEGLAPARLVPVVELAAPAAGALVLAGC